MRNKKNDTVRKMHIRLHANVFYAGICAQNSHFPQNGAPRKNNEFFYARVWSAGGKCVIIKVVEKWEASSINSMTGYGRCVRERDGRSLTVELKSVNHRFLDVSLRMPRCFLFLEDEARKAIGRRLSRGHVDVFCTYRNQREDARGVQVDEGLIRAYLRATDALEGLADDRSVMGVLSLPEVVQVVEAEEDQGALRALFLETLEGALDDVCAMRAAEGEALRADIAKRADALETVGRAIAARAPETLNAYRARLRANVEELLGGQMDEARLVQEVAVMADRLAIDEELVRLQSHVSQLRALLADPAPAGRRLDFLAQEFNREVNTIASKSQDIEITRLAMDGKAEIEKLREQVQNVE